jgi:hypothetical protein
VGLGLFLFLAISASAQDCGSLTGNAPGSFAQAMASNGDNGNVYVTGFSCGSASANNFEYTTVAYNSAGILLWAASYQGLGSAIASAIAVDRRSSNVYVTGQTTGTAGTEYATVAYSSQGTQLWTALYNGPASGGSNGATAIAVDSSTGNVYVTGTANFSYATVAYDSETGAQLWASNYQGPNLYGRNQPNAIAVCRGGHVYVTGYISAGPSASNYGTVAYDSETGSQLWASTYSHNEPANSNDFANAIAVDNSAGRVYVTGRSWGGSSLDDYATVAYDASTGNQLWVARYNGPTNGEDQAYAVAVDAFREKVFVTGESRQGNSGYDYATVAYDLGANQLWTANYHGPASTRADAAFAVAVDAGTGNVYVTGRSSKPTGSGFDYATLAYDTNGNQLWASRYDPGAAGNCRATAIGLGSRVNSGGLLPLFSRGRARGLRSGGVVYVTGWSANAEQTLGYDFATVAYDSRGNQLWAAHYNANAPANPLAHSRPFTD